MKRCSFIWIGVLCLMVAPVGAQEDADPVADVIEEGVLLEGTSSAASLEGDLDMVGEGDAYTVSGLSPVEHVLQGEAGQENDEPFKAETSSSPPEPSPSGPVSFSTSDGIMPASLGSAHQPVPMAPARLNLSGSLLQTGAHNAAHLQKHKKKKKHHKELHKDKRPHHKKSHPPRRKAS